MNTHIASVDGLREIVEIAGFRVCVVRDRDDLKQVTTQDGAVVNWFPSTGTLSFQGNPEASARLEGLVRKVLQNRGDVPLTF